MILQRLAVKERKFQELWSNSSRMNWLKTEQIDIQSKVSKYTVSKDKELAWPFWKEMAVKCVSKMKHLSFVYGKNIQLKFMVSVRYEEELHNYDFSMEQSSL